MAVAFTEPALTSRPKPIEVPPSYCLAVYDPPPLEVRKELLGQTTLSVELDGVTVALMDFVCPSTNSSLSGVRVSPVAGTVLSVTVTLNDLDTLPILTVIVELPAFEANTLNPFHSPFPMVSFLTVATLLFEEVTVKSPLGRMRLSIMSLSVIEKFRFEK